MAVRNKKRTDKVTLERVYRRLLALDHDMVNQLALIRLDQQSNRRDLEAKISSLAPIVSHCERLMREKVTLQRQVESANGYMAATRSVEDWGKMVSIARPTKCAFTHLHRPGIRCAVCHHIGINYGQ